MNQLNSVILEGNVTANVELREPKEGFKVCTIPLAVNRFYKNAKGDSQNEVSYFDVETFGKMAEICAVQCEKGRGLRVVGRLKQSRWKSEDGSMKNKISIVAEHVEFKPKFSKANTETEDLAAIAAANQAAYRQNANMKTRKKVDDEVVAF